jgi:threonylcarbamoyladenosine tRNA methylthiotransferase MtaB
VARRACAIVGLDPDATPVSVELESTTPTGRTRPGIKVQDGCDNRCTYCIVWKARGASRSMPIDQAVEAVRSAISDNAREVVLTGINLGRYDDGGKRLPDLLETLLERTDVGRLRLSSIEPQDVDDRLISLMASSDGRIAPYLHMCLQSGSDTVLRRMGRIYTSDEFAGRVEAAYASIPHLAIETDLIVGFPGETDGEFEESRTFCERMRFTHIHTFRYSKRPGTRAAVMGGQVPPAVSASRSESIRILGERLRLEHARSLIGSEDLVVTQAVGKGISGGLFDCTLDRPLPPDMLVRVRIADAGEDATLKAVVL